MILRIVMIGVFSAILLSYNAAVFGQVSDEELVRIIVTDFLLNSESEPELTPPILMDINDPVDIVIDGSHVSIVFQNSSISPLLSCSVIPSLPDGLTLQLVSEQDSCEIEGIPSAPAGVTFYRVTGENEVGRSSAIVVMTVSAL